MINLNHLIKNKHQHADRMISGIKEVIQTLPKREPGSEGEKQACEYFAKLLKNANCEEIKLESFTEHPKSFFGWLKITSVLITIAAITFYITPIISAALSILCVMMFVAQFIFYLPFVDFLFKKKTGTNLTAIKKCSGEVKSRIFFNAHVDAAWNWRVNNRFGGKVHIAQMLSSSIGLFCFTILSIVTTVYTKTNLFAITPNSDYPLFFYLAIVITAIFIIPWISIFWMVDFKTIVDGANDNLSGCFIATNLLEAIKDVSLENVEVGVILTGSEEAGLRGAKAWCKAHKKEYQDVPTWIYSYDTIHSSKHLGVNLRDLNGLVKSDKQVNQAFLSAASELNIKCQKTMVPLFGGATDAAAFTKGGFKATGITALNHVLEDYYHTTRDSYNNLNPVCLADTFAISAKVLENFINQSSINKL